MADEIPDQNVIKIWADAGTWHGTLGPAEGGIVVQADRPIEVICAIATSVMQTAWVFDTTYKPEPEK